jgi:O-ureido-D-serine cyclo-ligase
MSEVSAIARPVALITARAARAQDADLPLLSAALQARQIPAMIVDWDDPQVDWSGFALAVLRSAWDYSARLPEFLDWLSRAARVTRLVNPPAVIRWSLDKHYLAELQRSGVATVATAFAEPGQDAAVVLERFLREHSARELVVKPAVGSGARDAQRHERTAVAAIGAHISGLLAAGRSALLQPYLERIDEHGETALIYINGRFSHAIVKTAILERGQAPSAALFAPESIAAHRPDHDELEVGARVLAQLPFAAPLYARVDLLRNAAGVPCLLELELAEPSLYLAYESEAAARLATAVAELL